jgi:enoyl-CoA hydratase/carnithine racemase
LSSEDIRREEHDGVITMTLTRDEKRNAVSEDMYQVLAQAVRDLGDDDSHRVLIITAEGKWFTSGLDLSGREGSAIFSESAPGSTVRRQYRAQGHHLDLLDEMESVEKPIILAVQGHCLGLGLELGCSCDFRFAAEGATFSFPEVSGLGVIPGSGGISRMTRIVGPHWTKWMVMAGQVIDAEMAERIGWLHGVYPADSFQQRVREFAQKLSAMPGEAMGLAKFAIDAADSLDRRTGREVDRLINSILFTSEEFRGKVRAFTEAGAARRQQRN